MYTYWDKADLNYMPPQLQGVTHECMEINVVDDFFSDPDSVRQMLMNVQYEPPRNPKRGVISFNGEIPRSCLDEIHSRLSSVLDAECIEFHPRSKCAATIKSIPTNTVCHVDGGDNMVMFNWTVVIYMNTPEQCQGGTVLFRHRPSGDIYNRLGEQAYIRDFTDRSKWDLVERVDMKYNRALLCPAWRFHSIEHTFGDNIQNARLTVNPKVIAY